MKWDGNMEEKKEIKIEGFDDRNIKKRYRRPDYDKRKDCRQPNEIYHIH